MRISRPILVRILIAVVLMWVLFVGFIWWAMHQPPETFGRVMSRMPGPAVFLLAPFETLWTHARAGNLHPGDPAPDFTLMTLDKAQRVELAGLTAKQPVVLVFGSYT